MDSPNASTSNLFYNDHSSNASHLSSDEGAESSEEFENCLMKLDELKENCSKKNLEKVLLKRSIDHIHVAKYLDHMFKDTDEHSRSSLRNKRNVKQLLQEIQEKSKMASEVSKENRNLEKEIFNKKIHLKDCMQKRKKVWEEAAKLLNFASGNLSSNENSDLADESYESVFDDRQKRKETEYKNINKDVGSKVSRIVELSRILHNLISFSGVPWATNKNLLEILLCSGKIMERDFDVKNQKELRKLVDDITHRLNLVKI